MSTRKLDELASLANAFQKLPKKEQNSKKRQQAKKWEALQETLEVEATLLRIADLMRISASQGQRYHDVLSFSSSSLSRGWNKNLFGDEVPLDFLKDPVARKIFLRLHHMGYRPKIVSDQAPRSSSDIREYFKIVITW